jgi:hypothetical protein
VVCNVEPLLFPPGDIGRKFVRYVFFASMLPKLDTQRPLSQKDFLRWAGASRGKDSGKEPNGAQFRGRLHRSG